MLSNPCCFTPTNSVKISASLSMGFAIILIIFQSWMIKNATELHELPFKVQYIEFRNEFNFFKYKSRDFVRRLAENVIFTATEALRDKNNRDDPSKTFNPEEQIKWSVQRALAVKQGDLYMKKIINIFQVIKLIPLNERIPELFQHWFKNFLLTFELPNFDEMERVCWFAGFMGLAGGSFQLVSAATLLCSIEKKDKLSAKRWIWITFGVILDYTICALIIFSQDNANWIYSSFNFYAIVSVLGLNIFALLYFLWIVLAYVQLSSASAENNYIGKFV